MAGLPSNDSLRPGSGISPITQNLIRARLGMPVDDAASSEAVVHEPELDDFQRLLGAQDEGEFSRIASTIAIDATDSQGMTIGHHAARLGYTDAYLTWRGYHKKVGTSRDTEPNNFRDSRGNTPVDLAIISSHLQLLRSMASVGKNYSQLKFRLETCFKQEPANIEAVKTILQATKQSYLFNKALNLAVANSGNNELVDWLFENWPKDRGTSFIFMELDAGDHGKHPLNQAISSRNNSVLERLIHNSDLRNSRVFNPSPLEVAVESGNDEALMLLVQHRLLQTSSSVSPLYVAYSDRNAAAFKILVEEGVGDINQNNVKDGHGFLAAAMGSGRDEFVELLLELGADPMLMGRTGALKHTTALGILGSYMLSDANRPKYIRMFAEAGVDLSGVAKRVKVGNNPERIITLPQKLAMKGDADSLKLLHKLGVDLNGLNEKRENLLHLALSSSRASVDLFKSLVELGLGLDVKDKDGKTPVDVIVSHDKYSKYQDYLRTLV